ncbi:MAG: fimbria major subunit [Muribaculaceae bacterium]|nr:fimbria major subunit [Muribaculaceae bacterium]
MKKSYLFGAVALGLLFTACQSDELRQPEEGSVTGADQTLYVSMRISGDPVGTRGSSDNGAPEANDTDFASGNENAVNNAYFVFYDEDGNVVGDIVPIELGSLTADEVAQGPNVEKSYKSVVAVSVRKGEKKPDQVICYINPISPSTLNQPLSRIQTVSREDVTTSAGENTYFAMSNSVYYPQENENSEPQVAVKIPEGYLYTTEAAAEAALGTGNTVNIYVERYATKLSFTAVNPTDYKTATRVYAADGTPTTKSITLKFTPQYWAVNAEANREYVIKSFRQESEDGVLLNDNYTYSSLNLRINPNTWADNKWSYGEGSTILDENNAWDWNNPSFYRSYWGMSPAYFQNEYPEVSSDLREIEVNQKYISYNELLEKKYGYAASNKDPQYFKETTVGSKALRSANPNAAVASVIYVGQYSLTMEGNEIAGNPSFYTYLAGPVEGEEEDHPYIYFDNVDNSLESKVAGGESMLMRFFAQQTILYRKTVENGKDVYKRYTITNTNDLAALQEALVVDTITDNVKIAYDGDTDTKLKLQNNARTLQFKDAESAAGIYILTANGYKAIVADNAAPQNSEIRLTQANLTLMRQVGLSYYYTTGHAYFSIPVKHLGWYRVGNEQKNEAKINWNKVRVGDFGMVRNHSYALEVQEIKGLASGIGDDWNPIVPPSTTEDYFMAYSVRILKWAIVPTQKVEL